MKDYTQDWKLYLNGQNYNDKLNPPFYSTIDVNQSMYIGDQWRGVKANGLPTPVFNIIKRIINHQIASITSQDTKMQLVNEGANDDEVVMEMTVGELTEVLTEYFDKVWEKTKMSTKMRQLLLDGALTGDYAVYSSWDDTVDTKKTRGTDENGVPVKILGEIDNELIDSVNVFFGNPNDRRVNENGKPVQPYIILAFRQMTADLVAEAKRNGVPEQERQAITGDSDNEKQAGLRGREEIDTKDKESQKTTAIVKLWVKDGNIYARKSTKHCVIRKEWNTKRTLYPIAWGNWDPIKNSYHGQSPVTGLVPNQLFINKQFAMAMVSLMNNAFPKMGYDSTRVTKPSNQVGTSIAVEGDVSGAIQQFNPGQISPQVMQFIDAAIQYTKEMLGASDAALGDVTPNNTSAIIAVQQAAAVPLETIKMNLYQFIEDLGYIWLDAMIANYGEREIVVEIDGEKVSKTIDFSKLRDLDLRLKIDVGASSYWSQIASVQTLDNLLSQDRINFLQYLKSLPVGVLNRREELIKQEEEKQELLEAQAMGQQQAPGVDYETLAGFVEQLPPEYQEYAMQYFQGGQPSEM